MLRIPGYKTLEKIHEGKHSLIYRAGNKEGRQSVIFKTINGEYPSPAAVLQLKREYEITARFHTGGVIQSLDLASAQNSPVLILEDFGGIALSEILEEGPLDLSTFLSLAIRLTEILGEIHGQNIIHKDINPANIVWNRAADILKIIDFGISLELSREVTGIKNPNVLEGTLAYISPEQTGRMNRFLDYRTDYYSLGVTFYRMLAGRLPFEFRDAIDMVYAHIARQAPALHGLNPEIPRAVSDIVQKLMAKNVEDRYQSAYGLAVDLRRCKEELETQGEVSDFSVGQADASNRFEITQKLYGRGAEVDSLLSAFDRVTMGERELMLVSGLPGIGKSMLVNGIHKPILKLRGNFIAGKFDKFKKDVPYSALIEAFSGLMKHLLAEDEEQLEDWRSKIRQALGPNGRVITDVIPELELIIGKQAEIPALGPDEARTRFNIYFEYFIGVFCKVEHPLVLFLDDLQWADHASLEMLKLFLCDSDIKYLFVIGAFRSNEVDDSHGLNLILEDIQKSGSGVSSTTVLPLSQEAVQELLADSLHSQRDLTGTLAELLLRKTGGNPFFLGEFLKTIYQDGLLLFEPGSGWSWDVRRIEALQVTDNVVQLMAAKIERLPGNSSALLKLGACFGNSFETEAMGAISEKPRSDIESALNTLLEEGLILKLEDSYKFAHDRIQEAAYSLISEEERIREHHRIGRLELERTPEEELPQKYFYIVNHLNAARSVIVSDSEIGELARLNLLAGIKARSSAAYRPALNYLDIALGLLKDDSWNSNYEQTLSVYEEATKAAYLCGDYERMDELADVIIKEAHDVLDAVLVYEEKILAAQARNQPLQAVQIGLLILGRLGLRLPANPGKVQIMLGFLSVKLALRGKSMEDLENLPELKDPRIIAVARILSGLLSAVYVAMPGLFPLLISTMLKLSIKHGNTSFTPYLGYASYGLVQCGMLGNMDAGYGFGQLALKVLDKLNVQEGRVRTQYMVDYFIKGWKEHLRNTLEASKETIHLALEGGDPEFSSYSALVSIEASLFCGEELAELDSLTVQNARLIAKLKQLFSSYGISMNHQVIQNLRGLTEEPCLLKGDVYDVDRYLPLHLEARDQNNIFRVYFFSCFLNYIFGDYENALRFAELTEGYQESFIGSFFVPFFKFYQSLVLLALYPEAGKPEQKKFMKMVQVNQKKMKHWATHAPMNYEHKFQLVEAELARVQGRDLEARTFYERAIKGARENQFINEEALALELFAKFWLAPEEEEIAGLFMDKARQAYRTWGASGKVKHLELSYPQLFQTPSYQSSLRGDSMAIGGAGSEVRESDETTTSEHETTGRSSSGKLDLAAVVRASQTISGEIVLSKSLEKMMKIVMKNAGARKAFLILETDGELFIEAAGFVERDTVTVLQSEPVKGSEHLPENLLRYVARTNEIVVLEDASSEGEYTSDAYVLKNKTASILCAPILNQGKLSAVLYLENNAATGAFTGNRVEVLGMLSSQIAVSIDNARLYASLEEKVKKRTSQLESANLKLREVDQLKNNLFTNISHEIRTPLTLILSPLDNLMQNQAITSEPAQLTLLNTMAANGQRLLKQVNDMLDLAKFDADKMLLRYQRLDIVDFIRTIGMTFQPLAESKNIDLRFTGESSLFTALDPEKFEKAILNLLGNAFKFTESGEIRIEIHKGKSNNLIISIRDSGSGIPEGKEEFIFQRFSRANGGDARPGTGIGLALVREIIRMHKGRAWAEPTGSEGGAEFIIELPIGPVSEDIPLFQGSTILLENGSSFVAPFGGEGNSSVGVVAEANRLDTSADGAAILIVEDNKDMRDYLTSILETQFRVIQAENGKLGLELARKSLPDLILSDVMMPELDGLEMLAELRKYEDTRITPVVLLSAKSELAGRLEGLSLGADDYIPKPFRPAELLLKIKNLLHKNSLIELERHKEREIVFADLHDYLGGSLTDMSIMVKRMKRMLQPAAQTPDGLLAEQVEQIGQLEGIVQQAVRNYRQCFAKVEELNHLQGDFLEGLHLILVGRYSNFDREISFRGDNSVNQVFQDQRLKPLRQVLYAVIMEVVTNDLKYGMDLSHWELGISEKNEFLLEFSASTDESKLRPEAGRGTGNIQKRVKKAGGVVQMSVGGGLYNLSMRIPLLVSEG